MNMSIMAKQESEAPVTESWYQQGARLSVLQSFFLDLYHYEKHKNHTLIYQQ